MRLIRRVPKRGFNNAAHQIVLATVNVADLGRFDNGAEVTEESLRAAGLIKGFADVVKVLGDGELNKKLTVRAHGFSASARVKIEGAGGACVVVE
jgi:large subunit ribosomal protein L15